MVVLLHLVHIDSTRIYSAVSKDSYLCIVSIWNQFLQQQKLFSMLPQMSFLQIKMLGVRDVEVRAIDELVLMNYHFDDFFYHNCFILQLM